MYNYHNEAILKKINITDALHISMRLFYYLNIQLQYYITVLLFDICKILRRDKSIITRNSFDYFFIGRGGG